MIYRWGNTDAFGKDRSNNIRYYNVGIHDVGGDFGAYACEDIIRGDYYTMPAWIPAAMGLTGDSRYTGQSLLARYCNWRPALSEVYGWAFGLPKDLYTDGIVVQNALIVDSFCTAIWDDNAYDSPEGNPFGTPPTATKAPLYKDIRIDSCMTGFFLEMARGVDTNNRLTLENVEITNCRQYGIILANTDWLHFKNVTLTDNGQIGHVDGQSYPASQIVYTGSGSRGIPAGHIHGSIIFEPTFRGLVEQIPII